MRKYEVASVETWIETIYFLQPSVSQIFGWKHKICKVLSMIYIRWIASLTHLMKTEIGTIENFYFIMNNTALSSKSDERWIKPKYSLKRPFTNQHYSCLKYKINSFNWIHLGRNPTSIVGTALLLFLIHRFFFL